MCPRSHVYSAGVARSAASASAWTRAEGRVHVAGGLSSATSGVRSAQVTSRTSMRSPPRFGLPVSHRAGLAQWSSISRSMYSNASEAAAASPTSGRPAPPWTRSGRVHRPDAVGGLQPQNEVLGRLEVRAEGLPRTRPLEALAIFVRAEPLHGRRKLVGEQRWVGQNALRSRQPPRLRGLAKQAASLQQRRRGDDLTLSVTGSHVSPCFSCAQARVASSRTSSGMSSCQEMARNHTRGCSVEASASRRTTGQPGHSPWPEK